MNKKIIITCILLVLLLPITFLGPRENISVTAYLLKTVLPIIMVAAFAINYYKLIPQAMKRNGKHSLMLSNIILISVCCLTLLATHHFEAEQYRHEREKMEQTEKKQQSVNNRARRHRNVLAFWISATIIDTSIVALAIFVAYAMRSNEHINALERQQKEAEMARQRAEVARQKAELKGLRNQISPHFLLNTLNNIYALAAINTERTQKAVMQLSQLLRHTLYDNQQEMVTLLSEAKFISSYIDLMKLRLTSSVKIETNINVDESSNTMVAPLLFISLVENAFKHGVAATGESSINISLYEDARSIVCDISNSNNPKMSSDRSGHGIGLHLVQQRLESIYKGRYSWVKGVDNDNIYHSKIIIEKI